MNINGEKNEEEGTDNTLSESIFSFPISSFIVILYRLIYKGIIITLTTIQRELIVWLYDIWLIIA